MDNQTAHALIDRILYLASLASKRQDVDPMLDTVRDVTSRWNGDAPLAAADESKLKDLEIQMKHYLVTRDPLRSFTIDSLERRVVGKAKDSPRNGVNSFLATILSSCIAGILAFVLPLSARIQERAMLGVSLFFLALHIGAARFYITALRNFKTEFRKAYMYLAAASILLSLGFTHYALIELFDLNRYEFFRYAGIIWLIAIPFILMYLGLRIFAQLLRIQSPLISLRKVGVITVVVAVAIVLAPQHAVPSPLYFELSAVGAGMICLFPFISFLITLKIKRVVTAAYAHSTSWLCYYMLAVSIGAFFGSVVYHLEGQLYGTRLALTVILCGILPQTVLLYASYLFKKETSR